MQIKSSYKVERISWCSLNSLKGVVDKKAKSSIAFDVLKSKFFISPRLREVWTKSNLEH